MAEEGWEEVIIFLEGTWVEVAVVAGMVVPEDALVADIGSCKVRAESGNNSWVAVGVVCMALELEEQGSESGLVVVAKV